MQVVRITLNGRSTPSLIAASLSDAFEKLKPPCSVELWAGANMIASVDWLDPGTFAVRMMPRTVQAVARASALFSLLLDDKIEAGT